MFEVIPAIDILDGKCVRLTQGDFARETVYSDDPVATAQRWEAASAPRIHIVDLDGSRAGRPTITPILRRIRAAVDLPLEVGGGLRSIASITELIEAGVQRVVLGTAAVENEALVIEAVERYGDGIIVGVDARDGIVATHGWTKAERVSAFDLVKQMEAQGVVRFIYTDIARDGILEGPNFDAVAQLQQATSAAVIASGGVTTIEQLRRLAEMGVEGAIVGRAIYSGHLDLRAAVAAVQYLGPS